MKFEDNRKKMEDEIVKEFKDAEELVRECLKEKEKCRNNDNFLIWYIKRHKQKANLNRFSQYRKTYNSETIRRNRAKIQNKDNDYLPTDPEVIKKRKFKEDVVKDYFGKSHSSYRKYQKIKND